MGLIREPDGVDFFIQSKPLTLEEEKNLSKYIKEYKINQLVKNQAVSNLRRKKTLA